MPLLELECKYCGAKFNKNVYSYNSLEYEKCFKCGSSDFMYKDLNKDKIDYYQGAPAFPQEKKDEKDVNYEYF